MCSPTGAIVTAAGSGHHTMEDVTSATSPARIFENLRGPKGQSSNSGGGGGNGNKPPEQLMKRYQENVDGSALVIFPTAFLLFNIAYWGHYLTKWSPADLFETAAAAST